MSIFRRKKQTDAETESLKSFLDMIAPSIVKFETGYYICGNTFRCIWALREYPTSTDDLAILRHLGEKHGVTLHIYTRMVSPLEERKIVHNAEIRNRMNRGSAQDMQRAVEAESNLQDVANLIGSLHRKDVYKRQVLHLGENCGPLSRPERWGSSWRQLQKAQPYLSAILRCSPLPPAWE